MDHAFRPSKDSGFTLVEIIAVLVILGILAAVAVPKFFDLQTRARDKAVFTAISELKIRVNQHFSNELLYGLTAGAITYSATAIGLDLGPDWVISNWSAGSNNVAFSIKYPGQESDPAYYTVYSKSIRLPQSE